MINCNHYRCEFCVDVGVTEYSSQRIVDIAAELIKQWDNDTTDSMSMNENSNGEYILIGHSLGGLLAALTAKQICDNNNKDKIAKVKALILIAPAIIGRTQNNNSDKNTDTSILIMVRRCILQFIFHLTRFAGIALKPILLVSSWVIFSLFRRILYSVLRRIVYSRKFWNTGLRAAVLQSPDPIRMHQMVDNYAMPRLLKDWDYGFIAFIQAAFMTQIHQLFHNGNDVKKENDLVSVIKSLGIPVLIIHGDSDALV